MTDWYATKRRIARGIVRYCVAPLGSYVLFHDYDRDTSALRDDNERLREALRTIDGRADWCLARGVKQHGTEALTEICNVARAALRTERKIVCEGCGAEIDPDTCGCGEPINGYHDNHHPIPMGCNCFRDDATTFKGEPI